MGSAYGSAGIWTGVWTCSTETMYWELWLSQGTGDRVHYVLFRSKGGVNILWRGWLYRVQYSSMFLQVLRASQMHECWQSTIFCQGL